MRSFLALMLLLSGVVVARLFLGAPAPAITLSSSMASSTDDGDHLPRTSAAVVREPVAQQPVETAAREVVLDWSDGQRAAADDAKGDAGSWTHVSEAHVSEANVSEAHVSETHVSEAVVSCQRAWEPSTHMTQGEWAQTCRRVEAGGSTRPERW